MRIQRQSVISGIVTSRDIPVNPTDMLEWEAGLGNIQELMPYLTVDDREFILSGITKEEWNSVFAEQKETANS